MTVSKMPPRFQDSEPSASCSYQRDNCNYPTRRGHGSSGVELVALEGGLTRSSQAWDRQCERAARLLSACDPEGGPAAVEAQASSVMRMLASAPQRLRAVGAAGRPRNPSPPSPPPSPGPPPPGPPGRPRGRGLIVAALSVGLGCWFLAATLALFLLLVQVSR